MEGWETAWSQNMHSNAQLKSYICLCTHTHTDTDTHTANSQGDNAGQVHTAKICPPSETAVPVPGCLTTVQNPVQCAVAPCQAGG